MKPRIYETIIVEGRYDKNTVSQVVDAVIIETSGFGIFSDDEQMKLIRKMAETRGIIIFTDSDGAGFVIRNHIKGAIPNDRIKNAYIPDVYGKERRKAKSSKEGKLGVEGMRPEVIIDCLKRAGATFVDEGNDCTPASRRITKADMFERGLTGGEGSAERRRCLAAALELPEHISANALMDVLNAVMTFEEFSQFTF